MQQCRIWALDRLLCFATTRSLRAVLHIVSLCMRSSHHHCNLAGHRHFSMFTAAPLLRCMHVCRPYTTQTSATRCGIVWQSCWTGGTRRKRSRRSARVETRRRPRAAQTTSSTLLTRVWSSCTSAACKHKASTISSLALVHLSCVACWSARQSRECTTTTIHKAISVGLLQHCTPSGDFDRNHHHHHHHHHHHTHPHTQHTHTSTYPPTPTSAHPPTHQCTSSLKRPRREKMECRLPLAVRSTRRSIRLDTDCTWPIPCSESTRRVPR
jgi:hypothetical protein